MPSHDHTDLVAAVKADLERRGIALSGPCGAFEITRRVAWSLRFEGAGLLEKASGNNCEGYAVDIIAYPDGSITDILIDSGGANGPAWQPQAAVDPTRWRAPIDPGDHPTPAPGPTPAPAPAPPAPPSEPDDALYALLVAVEEIAHGVSNLATAVVALSEHVATIQQSGLRVRV